MSRSADLMVWGVLLVMLRAVYGAALAEEPETPQKPDWMMPVLNAMMCPMTADAWACGREQAVRMLDNVEIEIERSKQEIKDEADAALAKRIAQRAFSESEIPAEKPSDIMTTLDNYVSNGIYSFMGRKDHDHMKKKKKKPSSTVQYVQVPIIPQAAQHNKPHHQHEHNRPVHHAVAQEHDDDDDDDDDEEDYEPEIEVGHNAGGGHHHNKVGGHQHGPHRRPHHALGVKPLKHKYGRDLGVTRGKKHKKKFKKALMKLLVIGTILKAKLEVFLKVVAAHLQIKFFIIALLGLLINVAKFWIDLKKGHQPQKVIYYEHAQHQHHYDEHDDGWGGGSGGYWKRSFNTAEPDSVATSEEKQQLAEQSFRQLNAPLVAHQMAYSQQMPVQ